MCRLDALAGGIHYRQSCIASFITELEGSLTVLALEEQHSKPANHHSMNIAEAVE